MIDPQTLEVHQVIKFKLIDGEDRYGVVLKTSDLFKEVVVRSQEKNIRLSWRDSMTWEHATHEGHWTTVSKKIADQIFTGKEIKKKMDQYRNRKQRRKG